MLYSNFINIRHFHHFYIIYRGQNLSNIETEAKIASKLTATFSKEDNDSTYEQLQGLRLIPHHTKYME